jgi:uncharacterized membrane protein
MHLDIGTWSKSRAIVWIFLLGLILFSAPLLTASASFTISASPFALTVQQGHQGAVTITTAVSGGFNGAIALSASGIPSGTTVSFNPNPIPAPGGGSSTMTIKVASSTLVGTYPITVTGNGSGIQQNTTATLTVTPDGNWQQGFDFRNTATFVTDPPGDTYVLPTMAYPTKGNGVTFGWVKTSLVQGRDRNAKLDPRLAGINYATNGSPATFYVDLPSAGTYSLALALGDAGYQSCWVQCQIQFLDGSTVLDTVTVGSDKLGYYYDAQGNNWSAASWPSSNLSQQVTLIGTRLTVVVGTNKSTGDSTPIAFLGVTQLTGTPNFSISASPSSLTIQQGNQGTSAITTTISGGFNSAISLSASGLPSGTTVSFNPTQIPAPGSGSSTMTITVGSSTPVGTYPITVTGNGGGIQQNTTVTLTVTAQPQPNFTISASPASLTIQQGHQGTSTITTTISGGFDSAISLSASGAPSGTTVSFNPTAIPAPGAGTSTMTITVGSSTPTGTYPITVTGNGGGTQHNTTVTLTVSAQSGGNFTISASPASLSIALANQGTTTITTTVSGGFNSAISLSASGAPLGVSVSFNPQTIPAPGSGSSTMTVQVVRLATLGTYPITVTGSGGGVKQSTTVTLTVVSSQDFELSASPASLSIMQGNQGNTTITSTIAGGFNSSVGLSATGVPSGTTVSFNPTQIPAPGSGNSTVTLSVSMSTWPGVYNIVVAGSGSGLQRYTPLTLTVVAAPTFAIGASPSSLTIPQGNQDVSTINTFAYYGFSNSISLSASGAPSGTTLNLNPTTISAPGSGNSTLTVTVAKSTATGTYPVTVTGNGGGIQQTTTVNLIVTGGAAPTNANYLEPYSYGLQSSFGTPPYSYQVTSGSLPSGLSMNASGTIAGTATVVGKFNFQVQATDSSQPAQKQNSSYTLNVVIGMDEYSGLTAAPVPGCTPTGYFQLVKAKIGSNPARWVYADPNCYAFYQLALYDASYEFILSGILESHYEKDYSKWATHSLNREQAYGFNANDIFYSDYMLPIPKGGNSSGATPKLPFLLFFGATDDAINDPSGVGIPEAVKSIIGGQDSNGYQLPYNIYNLDIMDPNWTVANQGELALLLDPGADGFLNGFNATPWVAAISLGDSDEFVLFKGNGPGGYAHPAQVVATSAFNFNLPPINGDWQRPILYSKAAWTCNAIANDSQNFPPGQSFLEKKYGNIAALNASWGSNYTSFCDAGGFGTGTGVLDEDGRHTAWFGNDFYNQTGMNSNLLADLNAYMYVMALQLYIPQISVLKGYDTNHLMMCGFYGGSGDYGMRPQVAQGLHDSGCQVLVLTWNSSNNSQSLAANQADYDQIGLPSISFQASTAQVDSDMSNYPGDGAPGADYKTQQIRGQHYGTDSQSIFSAQGSSKSNFDYYNLGIVVWSLTDNSNEDRNWGFISLSDNVYDGVCATRAPSIDQWGYPCGAEAADYGDFTDGLSQANSALLQQLIQQLQP